MTTIKPPLRPTTISIPLQRAEIVEACPEVKRCHLEVIAAEHGEVLSVDTGSIAGTKVVRVGLFQEDKGCDYRVRVGLVDSGGPIAFGATASDGDPITYSMWERRLNICKDPATLFMPGAATHLMNTRYILNGETVVLIVCQMTSDGSFLVIVDRKGGITTKKLSLIYHRNNDNLLVTAALSTDLQSLYICESRIASGAQSDKYYWWTHNRYDGSWNLFKSGTVPASMYGGNDRQMTVDRDGKLAGFWGTEMESRNESDSDGTSCGNSWEGFVTTWGYLDYTSITGGTFDIRTEKYIAGSSRRQGMVLNDGKLVAMFESPTTISRLSAYSNWEWSTYENPKTTAQELSHEQGTVFLAYAGNTGIGSSKDDCLTSSTSGYGSADYTPAVPPSVEYTVQYSYTYGPYVYHDGSISLRVTAGGWVTRHEIAYTRNANTSAHNWTATGDGAPSGDFCMYALAWLENPENGRISESNINSNSIIYPAGLGEYASILKSFSATDEESGDTYTGIYFQAVTGGPISWRIFKNDNDVTTQITNCIGRPMAELSGIYWRAT